MNIHAVGTIDILVLALNGNDMLMVRRTSQRSAQIVLPRSEVHNMRQWLSTTLVHGIRQGSDVTGKLLNLMSLLLVHAYCNMSRETFVVLRVWGEVTEEGESADIANVFEETGWWECASVPGSIGCFCAVAKRADVFS
jgi:hypothetical protein